LSDGGAAGTGPKPRAIETDAAPAPFGPYSPAIAHGDTLYCAGQLGVDPQTREFVGDDTASQTEQALHNLAAVCEAAGTHIHRTVKLTVYAADITEVKGLKEIFESHLGDPLPARTAFQAAALPMGARIEIDAIVAL
jgi:2-iminobutanoate/2-iminopropanoate deaminase